MLDEERDEVLYNDLCFSESYLHGIFIIWFAIMSRTLAKFY